MVVQGREMVNVYVGGEEWGGGGGGEGALKSLLPLTLPLSVSGFDCPFLLRCLFLFLSVCSFSVFSFTVSFCFWKCLVLSVRLSFVVFFCFCQCVALSLLFSFTVSFCFCQCVVLSLLFSFTVSFCFCQCVVCLSFSPSLSLSVSVSVWFVSPFLLHCLFLFLSVCGFVSPFLLLCLCFWQCLVLYLFFSFTLFLFLSVCGFICPFSSTVSFCFCQCLFSSLSFSFTVSFCFCQ